MLCLSDHQTMAFKDQSTIPKATFIEISVYFVSLLYSPFKLLDTSIKSHVKENCSGAIMFQCACKGKFPREGLSDKWVSNFTKVFQSVRCPFRWIGVTQALGTRLWSCATENSFGLENDQRGLAAQQARGSSRDR